MGRRVVRTSSQDLKKLLLTPTGGRFFRPLDAFDEVYPGVILGDASTALSTCLLKELKVTHVLNAAHGKNDEYYGGFVNTSFSNYDQAGIKFMGIPALDTPSFYLRSYFRQAADFISDALRSGGKVLIHCQCGISRSATLVAAYLMLKKGMDAQQALSTIRAHRSIFPNQGFISQLCDFEYELKQAGSLPSNPTSIPQECSQTPKEPAHIPAFHIDHRPTFTSTKFWPLSRPVTKSGYPVSSVFCDFDFDPEFIPRSRSMDRYPSSYRARSSSPIPHRVPVRSASLGPEETLRASSLSPLSTYDITTTRPYVRPSYYSRTLSDYYYTTPHLYEPYYYTSRYYSDYDYASPFATRYYNRYYTPRSDSYYYSYRDSPYLSPYLSSVYSSYVPLSWRYPYSSYRYRYI